MAAGSAVGPASGQARRADVVVGHGGIGPVGAPSAARRPVPPPPKSRSFADLEEQLSSRLLAWVGGIALVLGAMFFLSLAFSRGWIGPEARVLIGLVAGAAALVAGAWLFDRGDRTPATVLAGVGVGTGSLALFAASRLYSFIPVDAALAGYLVLAVGTAAIALRANSQAVAAFGLLATTAAPPILGASPNLVTVAYLGAALVGTGLMSFRRSWPWLAAPGVPHERTAGSPVVPRRAGYATCDRRCRCVLGDQRPRGRAEAPWPRCARRFTALRERCSRSMPSSRSGRSMTSLVDPFARSVGLIVLADLHFALALPLLLRRPTAHPFGALVAGLAVGVLGIGIAIELGGIAVPIATPC